MTASTGPTAVLSELRRPDGSATFSQNGYTVLGAVNGPIEVSRRDELPEEAAVDVIVRPAAGVGSVRERHLEEILQSTLSQILLTHNFPRTLIQITLQILSTPENETSNFKLNQASSHLPILPALLQTSVMTLLSAALPLSVTMTSVLLAVQGRGSSAQIIRNPTTPQIQKASSVHVFAFSSDRKLLVAESEGEFEMENWEEACNIAENACCGAEKDADAMQDEDDESADSILRFVKTTVEEKIAGDLHWQK